MSDNVIEFPGEQSVDPLVGPFKCYVVCVEGRKIPNLTGWKEGEYTWLCVDNRFAIPVKHEEANQVAWLLGQAMAVAAGYSNIHAESKDRCFAPMMAELGRHP